MAPYNRLPDGPRIRAFCGVFRGRPGGIRAHIGRILGAGEGGSIPDIHSPVIRLHSLFEHNTFAGQHQLWNRSIRWEAKRHRSTPFLSISTSSISKTSSTSRRLSAAGLPGKSVRQLYSGQKRQKQHAKKTRAGAERQKIFWRIWMVELIWDERFFKNLQEVVPPASGLKGAIRQKNCAIRRRSFSSILARPIP